MGYLNLTNHEMGRRHILESEWTHGGQMSPANVRETAQTISYIPTTYT